jgi:hypothetical protein
MGALSALDANQVGIEPSITAVFPANFDIEVARDSCLVQDGTPRTEDKRVAKPLMDVLCARR